MKRLVWLASYPRSGNTWVRAFLAAYDHGALSGWNQVEAWHAADRRVFYDSVGVESTDLTPDQVRDLRPSVFRTMAAMVQQPATVKVHDAYGCTPSGEELFPEDVTAGAVYVIRNPLDVAVSWAHHAKITYDASIRFLAAESAALAMDRGEGPRRQLPQRLGTWSQHVGSWTRQTSVPVHVVRYEDLLDAPDVTFRGILEATGRSVAESRLRTACVATGFDRLRMMEDASGFEERPVGVERFFRRGIAGGWRDSLTPSQVERIVAVHAAVMSEFGYLSNDGRATL